MDDSKQSLTPMPIEYEDFLAITQSLALPNFEVHRAPLQPVSDYSLSQHGKDFPRPSEHFVIADYLIDLPIIAIDLGSDLSTYGTIVGYCYGNHWLVANSLAEFIERLKADQEWAVWGKP